MSLSRGAYDGRGCGDTVITSILTSNEQVPWNSLSDRGFSEWPALCCGDKQRWEMLELAYDFFALAFMQRQDSDGIFQAMRLSSSVNDAKWNRQRTAQRMIACSKACFDMWKRPDGNA